jgi:Uma2 family endonuclease
MSIVESPRQSQPELEAIPELVAGDRLTRDEFHRRYMAMPNVKKAELIEGRVYMPSPVSHKNHSGPHFEINMWLAPYVVQTPGTDGGDNGTVLLDNLNEPQPDSFLRILPNHGGQSRDEGDYIGGAPELIVEVAASSKSYDRHEKLAAYERNEVREYLIWRVLDRAFDWFVLRDGRYEKLPPEKLASGADGILKSEVFPGLWLDPAALLAKDMAKVIAVLQQGIASPEHADFVDKLSAAASQGKS